MDRDAPLGVRIITAAPEINGVLDAVHELDQRGIVFSIGHRYGISNCLRRISVRLLSVPRLALQRRTSRRKPCAMAHALSPTSSTRCLNCITATRPSSVFSVLHLTSALHLRPTRALRPLPRRLRLQHPQLAVPRVKCRCARQRKHKAKHSMTMKRHPRLPCWLLRASRAGFQD
jgi:hypothetical protein